MEFAIFCEMFIEVDAWCRVVGQGLAASLQFDRLNRVNWHNTTWPGMGVDFFYGICKKYDAEIIELERHLGQEKFDIYRDG